MFRCQWINTTSSFWLHQTDKVHKQSCALFGMVYCSFLKISFCIRKITEGKYEDKEEPHRSFEGHSFGVYMVRWLINVFTRTKWGGRSINGFFVLVVKYFPNFVIYFLRRMILHNFALPRVKPLSERIFASCSVDSDVKVRKKENSATGETSEAAFSLLSICLLLWLLSLLRCGTLETRKLPCCTRWTSTLVMSLASSGYQVGGWFEFRVSKACE